MIKNKQEDKQRKQNRLEYYNPIGLLIHDNLFITKEDKLLQFNVNDIKSIYFKKERDLHTNYLLILLSFISDFLIFGYSNFLIQFKLAGFLFTIGILFYAFLKKIYRYKILLITDHNNLFSIVVDKMFKEDACELISIVKGKIKGRKHYLRVS